MLPDIQTVTRLIEEVAATEILPRFNRLAAGEVREKGPGDLVTVADEAVEARLTPLLAALVPGSAVIGEEAAAADPAILAQFSRQREVWVIDPLDGTSNFAEGRPVFAVIVAFVRDGRTVAGWIHDPIGAVTVTAAAGEGAWCGDRRLTVAAAPAVPAEMTGTLLAGFFGAPDLGRRIQARRDQVRAQRSLRCAGQEYLRLVEGRMHFTLFTRLMPWDHAAGVLIHAEAGGHSAYLDGGGYRPAQFDAPGLLLTPDPASWQALRDLLLGD
ncbi:inositol monophosphatase family protein [Rhodospirillaceae bacterium SYSU D60014]|uniref:inositol monophosphatase family protein n=1 Tax=Virgifigura deserti TaxID=2268457 RepID=UPI000E674AFD